MSQARTLVGWLLPLLAGTGCKDLDQFETRHGESYCGSLVGQTTVISSDGSPNGISTGFEEPGWVGTSGKSMLSLSLNAGDLFKAGGVPAIVTSNDASFGPCGPDRPLFDHAGLRTVGSALGDRLAAMRLGEDHVADVTTFVDSTCSGSMVGILSLIQNGNVELRFLRPAPLAAGTDGTTVDTTARFGLFTLKKTKSGCGF